MLARASLNSAESLGGDGSPSAHQAGADQRIAVEAAPVRRNARRFTKPANTIQNFLRVKKPVLTNTHSLFIGAYYLHRKSFRLEKLGTDPSL
jgi:hypothetical protein